MAGRIQVKDFLKIVDNEMFTRQEIREQIIQAAQENFEPIKQEFLIDAFDNHEITQEIEGGPESGGGVLPKGNLFSFIGFEYGSDPIGPIKEKLITETRVLRSIRKEYSTISINGIKAKLNLAVRYPSLDDLESLAPMPFESESSWLRAIERGIPNFSSYIYWKTYDDPEVSRSTTGTLAKDYKGNLKKIRSGGYSPRQYISAILRNFKSELQTGGIF